MWSGAIPAQHCYHVLRVAAEVVRRSMANTTVKSVLIRKHQGRESGASQPHIHIQAIGADRIFPDVERDLEVTAQHPHIWQESVDLMRELGFHIEEGDGIASHWSPFGKFGRHFEVISLQDWQPLPDIPDTRLRLFAQYTHRLLRALGTAPYDLEIHHGEGIPLHLHLNGRRYVYANIGGTLNSPTDVAENVVPPTRDIVRLLARQMAEEEVGAARARVEALAADLQKLLLPRDPNDERNVFLEIRAGTGGDESALFAGELLRMYLRYAERNRWQTEMISTSESELGGYKEAIVRIDGRGAYSKLKFESGGHRVQRVPQTEAQGRVHTSACTVAVLAEADEINDVQLDPSEIRVDVFRASGAGGQHVNKTESAVRITHLPTGIVVECQDDRSQHKNRERAMKILVARIKDRQIQEQQRSQASTRKGLIGSGDRSERIRTYNFPQGRVTDHRINLTLYRIAQIMDGDLDELTQALTAEYQAELLAALGEAA